MYCPKCGAKLAKEAFFCHKCGTKMPEELLNAEAKDIFATQASEDYDDLFSYPTDVKEKKIVETIKETEKMVSEFISSDPSVNEVKSVHGGLNFDIPDDWESISEDSTKAKFDDTDYSEDDLNFTIPEDWNI